VKFDAKSPLIQVESVISFERELGVVVFDRDGTLINDCGQHSDVSKMKFSTGAIDALKYIKGQGFGIAIATNQSGVASEKFTLQQMENFHRSMQNEICNAVGQPIDMIAICPHAKDDNCSCRKPEIGLLEIIEATLTSKIQLFVGDSECDVQAADNFGVSSILIRENDLFNQIVSWVADR
jgi:histidinol-phosphate phosphatase family protein